MRILPTNAVAVSKISIRKLHATTSRLVDLISNSEVLKCEVSVENDNLAHRNESRHCRQRYYSCATVWNGVGQVRSRPHFILNRHFTSGGGGSSKPVFTTKKDSVDQQQQHEETHRLMAATEQELDELLTSASIRAREISALAVTKTNRSLTDATKKSSLDKNSSASPTPSPLKETQNAIEAADALLALTSHSNFKMALDEKRGKQQLQKVENSRNKSLYLHSAFITVISWLCSVLKSLPSPPLNQGDNITMTHANFEMRASEQDFILAKILDLMSRSTDLKLPLHLPLYRRIATLLTEYNTTTDTSLLILDLSTQARLALSVCHENPLSNAVLTSEFFSEPLKILARSNQTGQIIDVIEGMNSLHQLKRIDNATAYEMLMILSQHLHEIRKNLKNNPSLILKENYQSNISNITQLTNVLEEFLSEQISEDNYDIENDVKFLESDFSELDKNYEASTRNKDLLEDVDVDIDDATRGENMHSLPIKSGKNSTQSQELSEISLDEKIEKILKGEGDDQLVEDVKKEANAIIKSIRAKKNNEKHSSLDIKPQKSSGNLNRVDAMLTARVHVDPVTGKVENVELAYDPKSSTTSAKVSHGNESRRRFSEETHQSMVKEIIYLRNSDAWDLPDITQQLQNWNNDNDILFSKEYETSLLNEYMSYEEDGNLIDTELWNDLDHFDDDDFNDDDDDGFS